MDTDKRPILDKNIKINDFLEFYWLKKELVIFCKKVGIPSVGSKIELTNFIKEFLQTWKTISNISKPKNKLLKSTQPIDNDTIIWVEYRTYLEKKNYLQSKIGKKFHFTLHLMQWFEKNAGCKTYKDLVDEWYKEMEIISQSGYKKPIPKQCEYNRYIRDFMSDNLDKSIKDAINFWKLKKSTRGSNVYNRADLELK